MLNKKENVILWVSLLGITMLIGVQSTSSQRTASSPPPEVAAETIVSDREVEVEPHSDQGSKIIAGVPHRVERYERIENLPQPIATLLSVLSDDRGSHTPEVTITPEEAILRSNLPDQFKDMLINYNPDSHPAHDGQSELDRQPEDIKQLLAIAQIEAYPPQLQSRDEQNIGLEKLNVPDDLRAMLGQIDTSHVPLPNAAQKNLDGAQALRNALPDELHFLIEGN